MQKRSSFLPAAIKGCQMSQMKLTERLRHIAADLSTGVKKRTESLPWRYPMVTQIKSKEQTSTPAVRRSDQ